MMIHKDLFCQKEEIEKKMFLSYDNIPTETRQKVIFVISENVLFGKIGAFSGRPLTDDYHNLMYEISKYKGIPNISDILDDQKAINELLLNCSIEDFLRAIELFIYMKEKESTGFNIRLYNTINDINDIFKIDKVGYEIVDGKIQKLSSPGFETLIKEAVETNEPKNIDLKVKYSISKFSRYNSSVEDKKEAVRTLADVLEYLQKSDIRLPKADEKNLFNIINNFDIRHLNRNQQNDYDKDIWYDWMFYTFLASIHVLLKLDEKQFNLEIQHTE
jgi:hypothetical protein